MIFTSPFLCYGGHPVSYLENLGVGSWQATKLPDSTDKPDAWVRRERKATQKDRTRLDLAARGGFVGRIRD